jgi:serine/threonine protein kinase
MNIGKFEILTELGKGAFGTAYRARDTMLDIEIALNVLKPVWMDDREARSAAR